MYRFTNRLHRLQLWAYIVLPIVTILSFNVSASYGIELSDRSIAIANASPSTSTNYSISFGLTSAETLGSIEIQFCSNSAILFTSCTAPSGFDLSSAVLSSQSGVSGFSISGLSNSNTLILTRSATVVNPGILSFVLSGVTNPSTIGSFYARDQTFATIDASGSPTDVGGMAMAITSGYTFYATVPPYLYFCVAVTIPNYDCTQATGNQIDFGNIYPSQPADADSQMVIATNALNGYTIELSGNTMTSGNNVIPPLSSGGVSLPGTSQFGLNLVSNSNPATGQNPYGPGTGTAIGDYAVPNIYSFSNGDNIADSSGVSSFREYTISYILNIAKNQPPGVYSTTVSYTAMAYF